jgi:3-isopropylmalate dehydrogenase
MLLRHSLALEEEARAVERAVDAVVMSGARTGDMGGSGAGAQTKPLSTHEMGEAVRQHL